jgi:S-formylglutathione hydrolase FrmB
MTKGLLAGSLAATATAVLLVTALAGGSPAQTGSAPPPTVHEPGDHPPRFIDMEQLPSIEAKVHAAGQAATGTTVTVNIPPTRSHFQARPARVYLPPVWFAAARPRLPTLILLPGVPGGPTEWTDSGYADEIANDFAAGHGGTAPLIVMPDPTGQQHADSECVNSARYGNAETYLAVDIPDYMRAAFRAGTGARSLAVAGLSAGGTCSTTLGLRNPGIFPTFASFSGYATPTYLDDSIAKSIDILYGGSELEYQAHDPLTLLADQQYPDSAAWFEAGTSDQQPWAAARTLAAAARQAAMSEVCLFGVPGGHTWTVWEQAFSSALPWLSARLGLIPAPPAPLEQCSHPSTPSS